MTLMDMSMSVDYDTTDVDDILKIDKYLMRKKNVV